MIDWLKIVTLCGTLSILLLGSVSTSRAQDAELQDIADELAQDPNNPILLMQQRMLQHKHGKASAQAPSWRRLQGRTNLRAEVAGGMSSTGRRNALAESVALLTGQRAIDESLQLGSIGRNQPSDEPFDLVSIDDIAPVDIVSHPWAEMIEGQAISVPDIAKLIPKDMLFIHMKQPAKFLELENILKQQSELFGDVYNLGSATRLKGKMMKRLGIPDADALILAVDEMAFVSDDLAFVPRTDYALVLKLANVVVEKGFDLLVGNEAIHRKVGDYVVIATHESLIDRIENAVAISGSAIASELDYHYALLKMAPQRDGLIYLSEAFIRKLTGPAYRINSRRRNTVLDALETLQYSVFAYRRINGDWPASVEDIVADKLIVGGTLYAPHQYHIDKDGRVSHDIWGSLWQVSPVNQVPLGPITAPEKVNYEQFSAGYQSFFREFFDPIGIAYTISDQLYLHTLILPLINNSNYRQLQSFFGGEPDLLSFLFDADRLGAVNLAAVFSVDDLLVESQSRRGRVADSDDDEVARREQLIYEAERQISEQIFEEPLAPGERLLDFIGDEIFFGVGEKNSFSVSNIADIDVWFGLKLKDRDRAETFFRRLWQRVAGEFGGRGGGMLQLSSTEPLSNEYNGQKFYLLPTGFVNVFYTFFDDAFYVTVSQVSMNRLIDARNENAPEKFSENLQRGFAHVGSTHNIVAAMDLEKVGSFEIGQDLNIWGHRVSAQFVEHRDALEEAMTLAEILPDYDGTLGNVDEYYRELPKAFYKAQFEAEGGTLYLATSQQRVALTEIPFDRRGRALNELLKSSLSTEDLRARVRAFRAATLGLSFVPEGLDVKLSIGNPNVSAPDTRFSIGEVDAKPRAGRNYIIWILILVAFVASAAFIRRRLR